MSGGSSEFEKKLQAIGAKYAHMYVARKPDNAPMKEFKLIEKEPADGMSGMAEVLAAHGLAIDYAEYFACTCGKIQLTVNGTHSEHLAAALTGAGFGDVREAKARALEEAATDFEDNMGVTEFDEWARRDGRRWTHIDDAWEYQGPYMDWLRARAAAVLGEG